MLNWQIFLTSIAPGNPQQGKTKKYDPSWLAIALESENFSAYFGLVEELEGNHAILMSQKATSSYQWFAKDEAHGFDPDDFKNVYDKNMPMQPGTIK